MKKLIATLVILLFGVNNAQAFSLPSFKSVKAKAAYSNETKEIGEFVKKHLEYSNTHNSDEIKKLYDKNYINSDGFTFDVYFDVVRDSWEKFPDIKYDIIVKDIKIDNQVALVEVTDIAYSNVKTESELKNYDGILRSTCDYLMKLKKINNEWKIVSEKIINEETTLKFGDAKYSDIFLEAPMIVQSGDEYCASLAMQTPPDTFVLASINNERVVYPSDKTHEVYRKLPEDGLLERLVRANKESNNEYIVASVGMTKARYENSAVKFVVTGAAFIIKKVDVIPKSMVIQPVAKKVNQDVKTST